MKFASLSACVFLAFVAVVHAGPPMPMARAAEEPGPIAPRAAEVCNPSKCLCNGVSGLFCGNQGINPSCTNGDVFQCNPSGATCNFGVRDSCKKCGKLTC